MRHAPALMLAALAVTPTGGSALAQRASQPPVRTLPASELEYRGEFSRIVSLRELSDGRVLVGDSRERLIHLIDLRTGRATSVAREGQGPGEFASVGPLIPAGGDTTLLVDSRGRRLLTIAPSGSAGPTIPLGSAGESPLALPTVLFGDRHGRHYAEESSFRMPTATGMQFPESLAVLRVDRRASRTDTIGWSQQPRMSMEIGGTPSAPQMRMRGMSPFAPRDAWTAAPDGSVAIVRAETYRVEWVVPGSSPSAPSTRVIGPPIQYERLRVTQADKDAVIASSRRAANRVAGASAGPPPGVDLGAMLDQMEWTEFKPPFNGSPHIAPDGRLWVPRTGVRMDDPITYDVIDRRGQVVERVTFPARTRLLAFGARHMYTVRMDDDDLEYLQRRPL